MMRYVPSDEKDTLMTMSGTRYRELIQAEQERDAAFEMLNRLCQWDMMDIAEDGKYWRHEIDRILDHKQPDNETTLTIPTVSIEVDGKDRTKDEW